MKGMFGMAIVTVASVLTSIASAATDGPPPWAYGTPGPAPAGTTSAAPAGAGGRGGQGAQAAPADASLKHLPGSTGEFTVAQIRDAFGPADWYPGDHPT